MNKNSFSLGRKNNNRTNNKNGIRNFIVFLCSIQFTLPVLFTAPVITYDSQGYLASAKSLFSKDFGSMYFFARTPGYPLFLKTVLKISGGSFRFVIIVQSALVSISTFLLLIQVFKKILKSDPIYASKFRIVATLCSIQIGIIGYAAAALQQSLIVAFANTCLAYALYSKGKFFKKNQVLWGVFFLVGYSVWPLLCLIPAVALFISLDLIKILKTRLRRREIKIFINLIIMILPTLFFATIWGSIANQDHTNNPNKSVSTATGLSSLMKVPGWFLNSPQEGADVIAKSFVGQSGLIPSTGWNGVLKMPNPPIFENRIHAEEAFSELRKGGLYDSAQNAPWVTFAKDSYILDRASLSLPRIVYIFLSILTYLIKITWVCSPLFIIFICIVNRRFDDVDTQIYRMVSLPVLLYSASYIVLGAEIDRYALPGFFPVTLLTLTLCLQMLEKNHQNQVHK